MTIVKPKMLKGKLNINRAQNALYTSGLILGALGSKIDIKTSPEFEIGESKKYLIGLLRKSGCSVKKTKYNCSALCGGLMKNISVDAVKCEKEIFFITVFLCFLKGNSKIFNFKAIDNSVKERLFLLIGNLKKIGADIVIGADEIQFYGKQVLNGAEVCAYGDFDIFAALCIAAHRCEGNLNIKSTSGIDAEKYIGFKNALVSVNAEIKEKDSVLKMRKNIVLTGMSGAGKSHVGKELAEKLGFSFYDSDEEFEKEEKRIISDVFSEDGEAYFRKRESEVIKKLSRKSGCVISTGGGAVLKEENISNLKVNGIIFYLERDIDIIANTVDGSGRPLFKGGKTAVKKLFKDRKDIYEKTADYRVSNNGKPEEAIENICKIYKEVVK